MAAATAEHSRPHHPETAVPSRCRPRCRAAPEACQPVPRHRTLVSEAKRASAQPAQAKVLLAMLVEQGLVNGYSVPLTAQDVVGLATDLPPFGVGMRDLELRRRPGQSRPARGDRAAAPHFNRKRLLTILRSSCRPIRLLRRLWGDLALCYAPHTAHGVLSGGAGGQGPGGEGWIISQWLPPTH